jgi:hypothetical protein
VRNPTPNGLRRVAEGYEEPFEVLMTLAGYIESDPQGLTRNQRRALSLLGPDPSNEEVAALRGILDLLRGRSRRDNEAM